MTTRTRLEQIKMELEANRRAFTQLSQQVQTTRDTILQLQGAESALEEELRCQEDPQPEVTLEPQ